MAALTHDHNPLHFDDAVAQESNFKGRIAHGLIPMGMISALLGTKLPGPGTIYISQKYNFLKPIYPRDIIKAIVTVTEIHEKKSIITLS
ncbi:MAG: MaoC family dehydratase, partial [Methanosarcinaceae archaeon]